MSEPRTYRIYGVVTGGKYLGEVQASSREEAKEKAWEELDCDVHLCHHCTEEAEDARIEELVVEGDSE